MSYFILQSIFQDRYRQNMLLIALEYLKLKTTNFLQFFISYQFDLQLLIIKMKYLSNRVPDQIFSLKNGLVEFVPNAFKQKMTSKKKQSKKTSRVQLPNRVPNSRKNFSSLLEVAIVKRIHQIKDNDSIIKQRLKQKLQYIMNRIKIPNKLNAKNQFLQENRQKQEIIKKSWEDRPRSKRLLSLLVGGITQQLQSQVFEQLGMQDFFQENKSDIKQINEILREQIIKSVPQQIIIPKTSKFRKKQFLKYLIQFKTELEQRRLKIYRPRNKILKNNQLTNESQQ